MSDEPGSSVIPEAAPATEPAAATEQAATPALDTQAAPEVQTEAEPRTFTQAELDAVVQKEKAKAAAIADRRALKAYRETLERVMPPRNEPQERQANALPTRDQFASDSEYVAGIIKWDRDAQAKAYQEQMQQQQSRNVATKTDNIYAQAAKIPGFDREAFDELPLTPAIAAALVDSDIPDKLMHYMAANPDEVAKIAGLSPARQAAAIGKLEDKVSSAPKASNAPPPIKPIGSGGRGASGDLETMPYAEYKAKREKEGASWARNR